MLKALFSRTQRTPHSTASNRGATGALAAVNAGFDPTNPLDISLESAALSQRGFHAEAHRALCDALALLPGHAALSRAQGSVLYHWGRYRDAIEAYRRADAGMDPESRLELGWALFFAGRPAEAETTMRQAVEDAPDNPSAHAGLAFTLHMQKRFAEALDGYRRGLTIDPANFECLTHGAHCLLEDGQFAEAETMFRRAIEAAPRNTSSWINLGTALMGQGRDEEVQGIFEEAVRLDRASPNQGGAFINLATLFRDTEQYEKAIALLEQELPRHPDGYAHLTYALLLLLTGRMNEGWRQHEFRWFSDPMLSLRGRYPAPVWSGQKLNGRTILIVAEQGAGDFIQFVRYVPMVKAMGASTLLISPPGMRAFAQTVPGADRVLEIGDELPSFDFYVPLMSLPLVFGTEVNTIPADVPYLDADAVRVQRWAPRLGSAGPFKVGLAWAGSPMHFKDAVRSMPLDALAPLWRVEGVRFFSLQKGAQESQLAALPGDRPIENLGPDLADYSDTAAVISQLDLVICVDTSVAHVAGALGKPVWLLLPHVPDWRWLIGREDTRWYPTMRLFRQRAPRDWPEIAMRVAAALEEHVNARGGLSTGHPAAPSRHPAPVPAPRMRERPDPNSLPGLAAVTETRFGIVEYLPDEPLVGDSIAWYGEYLQQQIELIGRIVRPGWTVLQVGAGVGLHGLFLAQRLGDDGHLLVYENRQIMRMVLGQNLAANRASNVTVMRRKLATARELGASSTVRGEETAERGETMPPITETIDDLRLERLDFLKVDDPALVQDALEGCGETLWRLRPLLFLALSDTGALTEVSAHAKDLGYRCWHIESPLFNPDNFNRRENDIFSGQGALALLAIPEEVEVNLALDKYAELA